MSLIKSDSKGEGRISRDWLKKFNVPTTRVFDEIGYEPNHRNHVDGIKAKELRSKGIGVIHNTNTNVVVIVSINRFSGEPEVSVYWDLDPAIIWENLKVGNKPWDGAPEGWSWSGGLMDMSIEDFWKDYLSPHLNNVKVI